MNKVDLELQIIGSRVIINCKFTPGTLSLRTERWRTNTVFQEIGETLLKMECFIAKEASACFCPLVY